jgi:WD40 repeat protein
METSARKVAPLKLLLAPPPPLLVIDITQQKCQRIQTFNIDNNNNKLQQENKCEITFSFTGPQYVIQAYSNFILEWDIISTRCSYELQLHDTTIENIAISLDFIAIGTAKGEIILFNNNEKNGERWMHVGIVTDLNCVVWSMVFVPDYLWCFAANFGQSGIRPRDDEKQYFFIMISCVDLSCKIKRILPLKQVRDVCWLVNQNRLACAQDEGIVVYDVHDFIIHGDKQTILPLLDTYEMSPRMNDDDWTDYYEFTQKVQVDNDCLRRIFWIDCLNLVCVSMEWIHVCDATNGIIKQKTTFDCDFPLYWGDLVAISSDGKILAVNTGYATTLWSLPDLTRQCYIIHTGKLPRPFFSPFSPYLVLLSKDIMDVYEFHHYTKLLVVENDNVIYFKNNNIPEISKDEMHEFLMKLL